MNRLLRLTGACILWTTVGLGQQFGLKPLRTFGNFEHGIRKAVFAPDGRTFATGGTRGEVTFWDVETGQRTAKAEGHYSSVTDLNYSRDGKRVVTASNDGFVTVWDALTGRPIRKVSTSEKASDRTNVHFALLSADGGQVFFGGDDRRLKVASVSGSTPFQTLYTDRRDAIRCAALSPDGSELVFAAGQYLIVWDIATGRVAREYNTGTCTIQSLGFSADGAELVSWCSNARVDIRNARSLLLKTSFRSGSGERRFSNMAYTDDGRYILTGDHASRFQMWDLQEKRLVMDEGADQGTVLDFDARSNPTLLLSASLDRTVKLWQIGEKQPEPEKKSKRPEPEPEVARQVVILTQSETKDDFTPMEPRDNPPTPEPMPEVAAAVQPLPEPEPVAVTFRDSVSTIPANLNGRRINPIRNEHRLYLKGRDLTISVWDAQVVDGDIISIYINNDCVLREHMIVEAHKDIRFNASGYRKVYLYLHAHNLGSIPPNTATMMVSDGIQDIQVELRSDLTGSAAMELNFVD